MKVTVIGTGLMGKPVAERLLNLGHEVVVFNRTRQKTEALTSHGAMVAKTAIEAIQATPCTILMLTDAQAIQDMLFLPTGNALFQRRTIIQMGTIAPSESHAFAQKVQLSNGDYLEAPVWGSVTEACSGKMLVMVGATEVQFERWNSLLMCLGKNPLLVGPVGHAASLKLAMNQLIASHIAAFSLSLGLVQRSGVRIEDFMKVLGQSAMGTPMFEKKLPRFFERNYTNPNFSTTHLLKDVNLFLREAQLRHLNAVSLEGISKLLKKTIEKGLGEVDYSSVFEIVNPSI